MIRRRSAELFGEDAVYRYSPFDEPVKGRDAIVASWLEHPDPPGTYDAHYETALIAGDRAVTNGRSLYFAEDGGVRAEWDNIFLLRFDGDGRCIEYTEWYMQRPDSARRGSERGHSFAELGSAALVALKLPNLL